MLAGHRGKYGARLASAMARLNNKIFFPPGFIQSSMYLWLVVTAPEFPACLSLSFPFPFLLSFDFARSQPIHNRNSSAIWLWTVPASTGLFLRSRTSTLFEPLIVCFRIFSSDIQPGGEGYVTTCRVYTSLRGLQRSRRWLSWRNVFAIYHSLAKSVKTEVAILAHFFESAHLRRIQHTPESTLFAILSQAGLVSKEYQRPNRSGGASGGDDVHSNYCSVSESVIPVFVKRRRPSFVRNFGMFLLRDDRLRVEFVLVDINRK